MTDKCEVSTTEQVQPSTMWAPPVVDMESPEAPTVLAKVCKCHYLLQRVEQCCVGLVRVLSDHGENCRYQVGSAEKVGVFVQHRNSSLKNQQSTTMGSGGRMA